MEDIKSGILSGVKIDEEKARILANVEEKLEELDNGVIDPEEIALGDMMGAGSSVEEESRQAIPEDAIDGSQVADHGLLTGADTHEGEGAALGKVADTIEHVEAFESDGTKKADGIDEISDTLAVTMGVKKE